MGASWKERTNWVQILLPAANQQGTFDPAVDPSTMLVVNGFIRIVSALSMQSSEAVDGCRWLIRTWRTPTLRSVSSTVDVMTTAIAGVDLVAHCSHHRCRPDCVAEARIERLVVSRALATLAAAAALFSLATPASRLRLRLATGSSPSTKASAGRQRAAR